MSNYMLMIYSKEEEGELLIRTFRDLHLEVESDIEAFKQLHGSQYPEAVYSIYDRKLRKWTTWKKPV